MDTTRVCRRTLSSHKIYGPKEADALVATKEARKRLAAVMHGGGQERDLRSGIPNVPAIVDFGMACGIATREMFAEMDSAHMQHTIK